MNVREKNGREAKRVIPIAPVAADSAATVSLYASEAKIYPRAVHGLFAAWRWVLVWATQLVFYGLPWLTWNGRQALLFDLEARRFYIFGLVLYPQDFIYLTGLLVLSAYALFLFTAVAGRLWCGYACPQTVYTEIFLWVERHLEGDRIARMKLDAAPWSVNKLLRKGGKQAAWIAIGLWTGFSFVGYFTPIRVLAGEALQLGFGPWEWFWVLFYGFATYGNAGYMREQVCKYMCPYARFQSAMFDRDTLVIGYDEQRGEPRGSRPRSADAKALGKGDCIDCTLCVQVCPTGIDIRKGLQYECIGCAACIDVCDGVMDKMNYPRGLIRYATENGMAGGWTQAQMLRRVLRPRVLVYGAVMVAISAGFVASIALRQPFRVDVVRDRGTLARQVEDGRVENVYRLQVMNATESAQRYRVRVSGIEQAAIASPPEVEVGPTEARWFAVRVQLPPQRAAAIGPGAHPMRFEIERLGGEGAAAEVHEKSTFMVPR
ncbi:cytochrome c oxidase accessory protein CcoG [Rhizobacter sp. SG703]|uniref:cytochrome c oxidase accessory protein CcoG n=1 Tax=Rhizobacter sp. SG703 TaxID=2587140 RepID=UPI001447C1BF|nr:cytochrome c oxidase accessory protein CcoG [Rhizobacter sp. SG703]NKI94158.1 cytochrome c oxidase accessory protein FixG [Rhizobacter sp. SG703]